MITSCAAVHDQRRLLDGLQILVRLLARRAPFGEGFELRRRHLLVHLGIAVLAPQPEALQELAAGGLARSDGVKCTCSQRWSGSS